MNKKLNFFECLYCGWFHLICNFRVWHHMVSKTDGSQSRVFFDYMQHDYLGMVEFTWWRGGRYKQF